MDCVALSSHYASRTGTIPDESLGVVAPRGSWPAAPGSAGGRTRSSAAPLRVCCAPSLPAAPLLLQWRVKGRSRRKRKGRSRRGRTGERAVWLMRMGFLGQSGAGACPNLLQRRPGPGSAARRSAEYQRFYSGTPARSGPLQQIWTTRHRGPLRGWRPRRSPRPPEGHSGAVLKTWGVKVVVMVRSSGRFPAQPRSAPPVVLHGGTASRMS